MNTVQLRKMESVIRQLTAAWDEIGTAKRDTEELLKLIHRDGWTTPAELSFAMAALESMLNQTQAVLVLNRGFMQGARAVVLTPAAKKDTPATMPRH